MDRFMLQKLTKKRDFYAGGLLVLIGLVAITEGISDRIGTLMRMGPGFMPLALGLILVGLGVAIAGGAALAGDGAPEGVLPETREWRGWLCIITGPILFIILGAHGGLVPATFACVFVAALGDRTATVKSSLALAAGVTVFGVVVFVYLLDVPFPMFRW